VAFWECADHQVAPDGGHIHPIELKEPKAVSAELQVCARDIINRRRRRGDYFPAAIFDEIGWEILLTLYAFDEPIHTVAFVAYRLQRPVTTSRRWIDYLVTDQLVARLSHAQDDPASPIVLTSEGRRRIENYLAELIGQA
jgi:hypothetical protein